MTDILAQEDSAAVRQSVEMLAPDTWAEVWKGSELIEVLGQSPADHTARISRQLTTSHRLNVTSE